MRLLLDESVPRRFRLSLSDHDVKTVVDMGWSGLTNGKLLALAASKFDVFNTVDKNLPFQQNLNNLPLSLIVLDSPSTELTSLLTLVPALHRSLSTLAPRSFVRITGTP